MVDAPRRSYDCLRIDPCWDNQDDASSSLSHGHSFFFSAPTSPQMLQTLVQNNSLDLSFMPDSRFEADGNSRHKQDNDGNDDDDEFEFEFISNVSKWDEPPFSPTLILTSSSWMLLPARPLLKPPPHLRKPCPLSVEEPSPACEKSNVGEGVHQQEKCSKEKKWRLMDFLSHSNGQKQLPIPRSRPHGQQGSMSSPSSDSGKKTMNGTAMWMKTSPPSFPLPPPPSTQISSLPSSTGKIASTTPSLNEIIYRSTRAQRHNRQMKTPLPYHSSFLGCLGFASKCYIPIAEFSKGLQPAT